MVFFIPEDRELWELCAVHGEIISRHEKVSQVAILEMYDAILAYIGIKKLEEVK